MIRIDCVEDDSSIRELLEYTLRTMGYTVRGYETGAAFWQGTEDAVPDAVLLDIMLPDADGLTLLEQIRKNAKTQDAYVIMLTAKSSQMDKIRGLDAGADDYMTKPFDIMELLSRVKAGLRRREPEPAALRLGCITMDEKGRRILVNDREITLTYKEFELLRQLLLHKNMVLTRDQLMNLVWDTDFEGETRTVDVHIRTLRQKLGEGGELIETVRNVGYKACLPQRSGTLK